MKPKPEPPTRIVCQNQIFKAMYSWTIPHDTMALLGVILDLMPAGF